ncbi:hypothetical protein L207DRAFT_168113 [Hyaloscypha variabilis F]|uniref:Uncharacterized protein n=1 Tax=Hyaloscypha variabilis (strain UAMH 11265 / GT02V1 / F) TaxID=1149755 RepID=A0A2J6R3X8_HYAVF|nr:hypothetical protein L207DRAFT_168113 [Hyaloscypha variabilis F]
MGGEESVEAMCFVVPSYRNCMGARVLEDGGVGSIFLTLEACRLLAKAVTTSKSMQGLTFISTFCFSVLSSLSPIIAALGILVYKLLTR